MALECDESSEFLDELWRLNHAFGIGVIKLNAKDLISSEVLIPAKKKENLDFTTLDLLVGQNSDFKEFIKNVNQNIQGSDIFKKVIKNGFDNVMEDEEIEKYIKDKKII